jgi:hypothetical protein
MIIAHIHQCVFVIYGSEGNYDAQAIGNPILPEVPETELQERPPLRFGKLRGFLRLLAIVKFVVNP